MGQEKINVDQLPGFIEELNKQIARVASILLFLAKQSVLRGDTDTGELEFARNTARQLKSETRQFRPEVTEAPTAMDIKGKSFLVIADCASEIGCETCGWLVGGKCTVSNAEIQILNTGGGNQVINHITRFRFVEEIGPGQIARVVDMDELD